MQLATGTSGYSYKEWKGTFYPQDQAASGMLGFYAGRFSTVEINNTFYRMPNRATLEKWASEVPDGFTFVLKASQRITHQKRLKDAGSEVSYFLETAQVLGPKLGPILFQLPPNAKKNLERLVTFLELLPPELRFAFEFRHASWFDEEVYGALRARGVALCTADVEEEEATVEAGAEPAAAPGDRDGAPPAPAEGGGAGAGPKVLPPLVATAGFGYLRLRRCDYVEADLRAWAAHIRREPWSQVYVFFKHEDEGTGPKLALQFRALF